MYSRTPSFVKRSSNELWPIRYKGRKERKGRRKEGRISKKEQRMKGGRKDIGVEG
jgi:hypothetical protein